MTSNLTVHYLWTACILLVAVGCSGQHRTYPVNGKVQFANGLPVKVGTVELKSSEHPEIQARGTIEQDGSFSLTTYKENDGAIAGKHFAVIVQLVIAEEVENHVASTYGVIDPKHSTYATSGLTVDIQPNQPNDIVIEVEGIKGIPPNPHDLEHLEEDSKSQQ